MTRYFIFTEKARKENYDTDFFVRDADEIRKHHYCDDFSLYVSSYCVNEGGYLWEGNYDGMPIVRGIAVSSNDDATIDWFVRTWVKLGYLEAVIPVAL